MSKIERSFYELEDVREVARNLIGKKLCTYIDGKYTAGIIVETEAYRGYNDKGCHACIHGITERTRIMFGTPGYSYVYLCYGIHHMFNVVSNKEGKADATLIRAIQPLEGIEIQLKRRNQEKLQRNTAGGPGLVCQALGINTQKHYGLDLLGDIIWIEHDQKSTKYPIIESPRVGLNSAGEDAKLPWRYRIESNCFTSPAK